MKIQTIDFGYTNLPKRAHYNDAGADVYVCLHDGDTLCIYPGDTKKIPLGLGVMIPDGHAGCVFPRSGLASKGITCELAPIDSGYRGEIHAIVTNCSNERFYLHNGDRIGQLIIFPVILAEFVTELGTARNDAGFGSTGK